MPQIGAKATPKDYKGQGKCISGLYIRVSANLKRHLQFPELFHVDAVEKLDEWTLRIAEVGSSK
jgi:hypothetical protein